MFNKYGVIWIILGKKRGVVKAKNGMALVTDKST